MSARNKFFLTSLRKGLLGRDLSCPNCGSTEAQHLDKKFYCREAGPERPLLSAGKKTPVPVLGGGELMCVVRKPQAT